MKTVEEICAHRVTFNYFSKSKYAVPDELEIEHVTASIVQGYVEGELNMHRLINGKEREFRGWWSIQKCEC